MDKIVRRMIDSELFHAKSYSPCCIDSTVSVDTMNVELVLEKSKKRRNGSSNSKADRFQATYVCAIIGLVEF